MQVAAIQQELMVAALTCHDVVRFNAFQTSYSKALRRSDWRLRHMFRRLFGGRGMAKYHAFKTQLANKSSIRSIHDNAGYCKEAQLVFAAALAPQKPTLAEFVSGVAVHDDGAVDSCNISVATGFAGARAVPNIVPKPNPLRVAVLTPVVPVAVTPALIGQPAIPASGTPAAPLQQASAPAAVALKTDAAVAPAQHARPTRQAQAAKAKKSSGWLSSIFD